MEDNFLKFISIFIHSFLLKIEYISMKLRRNFNATLFFVQRMLTTIPLHAPGVCERERPLAPEFFFSPPTPSAVFTQARSPRSAAIGQRSRTRHGISRSPRAIHVNAIYAAAVAQRSTCAGGGDSS